MFTVTSRKFYSQIANGESFGSNLGDYTQNLVGSVMERIVAETEIDLSVISTAVTTDDEFTVNDTAGTITRNGTTTWEDEGWHVGDTFSVTGAITFTGTITALSGLVLTYTLDTGTDTPATYDDIVLSTTTDYLAAVVQFGLPENSDNSANYTNVVDGSIQAFTLSGLTTGLQTMNPVAGAKSWITGDCQVKRGALTSGVATYTIRQEFIILPYYLDEIADQLTDGTLPEDYFKGVLSLKYIVNLQVRKLLSDPNIQHSITDNNELGYVGWFGENYNGGVNNYECSITGYTDTLTGDSVTGIQIDRQTTIAATITNTASLFDASTKIGAYLSAILSPLDYAANSTLYKTLWLYDNVVKTNNITFAGLTGIIKTFSSTRADANTIDIEITTEFSASQQAQLTEGQQFIIALQTAQSGLARNVSDSVIMVAGLSELEKNADIPGLLEVNSLEHLYHPLNETDQGATNFRGWNEDGYLTRYNFGLDIEEDARLEELSFKLLAVNDTTGDEFTIQQYDFDLSSGVLVPEGAHFKQVFNLDTTRGFPLPSGDFFNRVRLGFPLALTLFFYGEEASLAPTTTMLFPATFAGTNYIVVFLSQMQANYGAPTKLADRFTLPAGVDAVNTPWIAIYQGTPITGIRSGQVSLSAGTNRTVTFTDIGTTDYTIIPCDLDRVGMDFTGMNASRTSNSFQVTTVPNDGRLSFFIMNTGLPRFRSGAGVSISAGTDNVPFASTFGTTNYTLFVFDTLFAGAAITATKNNDSADVNSGNDTVINYVAILN